MKEMTKKKINKNFANKTQMNNRKNLENIVSIFNIIPEFENDGIMN